MRTLLLLAVTSGQALAYDAVFVFPGPYGAATVTDLINVGGYDSVSHWDSGVGSPTLGDLQAYDVVFTAVDGPHSDPTTTGNALAAYVDAGGAVVEFTFNAQYISLYANYGAFNSYPAISGGNPYGTTSAMTPVNPANPIWQGVVDHTASNYWEQSGVLAPGATLHATFAATGGPAVASWLPSGGGRVVSAAYYISSATAVPGWWDPFSSDLDQLAANLGFLAMGVSPPFSASRAGTCPGTVALAAVHGTPGGGVAVASGTGMGGSIIPGGPCAGTAIPISGPRLRATGTFDATGTWDLTPTINNGIVCGSPLAFVDLTTCDVAVTALP